MILDRVAVRDLARMLEPHMGRPAWPGLTDPDVKARAREHAKKVGLWEVLGTPGAEFPIDPVRKIVGLQSGCDIPALKRSVFREFERNGSRRPGERPRFEQQSQIQSAALAAWLGHPSADVDWLQDLLWAWCETTTWIIPAHQRCRVDLFSSAVARLFAEIVFVLGDTLEPELTDRVGREIERRVLDGAYDWKHPDWWATGENNWNHVCNANVITTALYHIKDSRILAAYIHPLIIRLGYAIDGFADDGGCLEGPGYWDYGFGHFLDAAVVLHNRTGGELDITRAFGDKVEKICRYPLASQIEGSFRTTFADSAHGYVNPSTALKVNRFFAIPELYDLAARRPDASLAVRTWRDLTIYEGQKCGEREMAADHLLPDLGQVIIRSPAGPDRTTLAAIAGNNGVPHNHNDVGSFILFKRGTPFLVDPGAPVYTRKTFSPRRYEILFCRSRGHSVPIVNGAEQKAGARFGGTIEVEGLGGEGPKTARIDMTRAYDDPTLRRLLREFTVHPDGAVTLIDSYDFTDAPRSLEEAFVTYEDVRAAEGGRDVLIGAGAAPLRLAAEAEGRFEAERLVEESKEGRIDGVLTRITFTPAQLSKNMTLGFRME